MMTGQVTEQDSGQKGNFLIFDSDDMGCNRIISETTQSHDCRDALIPLHHANPNFKATLFAIPGEMTPELLKWSKEQDWVELAVHGFYHTSNYECQEMGLGEFGAYMQEFKPMLDEFFVKGFKAPGWQISDDAFSWLEHHDYWVADQSYNNDRRPDMPVYLVNNNSVHTHTWNCVGNGVYELFDELMVKVKTNNHWKFVSEVV